MNVFTSTAWYPVGPKVTEADKKMVLLKGNSEKKINGNNVILKNDTEKKPPRIKTCEHHHKELKFLCGHKFTFLSIRVHSRMDVFAIATD